MRIGGMVIVDVDEFQGFITKRNTLTDFNVNQFQYKGFVKDKLRFDCQGITSVNFFISTTEKNRRILMLR